MHCRIKSADLRNYITLEISIYGIPKAFYCSVEPGLALSTCMLVYEISLKLLIDGFSGRAIGRSINGTAAGVLSLYDLDGDTQPRGQEKPVESSTSPYIIQTISEREVSFPGIAYSPARGPSK